MARGTFRQELKEKMTAKHVLKQKKKRQLQIDDTASNYSSKCGLVWTEEKKLEEVRRDTETILDSPRSVVKTRGLTSSQRGSFFMRNLDQSSTDKSNLTNI